MEHIFIFLFLTFSAAANSKKNVKSLFMEKTTGNTTEEYRRVFLRTKRGKVKPVFAEATQKGRISLLPAYSL